MLLTLYQGCCVEFVLKWKWGILLSTSSMIGMKLNVTNNLWIEKFIERDVYCIRGICKLIILIRQFYITNSLHITFMSILMHHSHGMNPQPVSRMTIIQLNNWQLNLNRNTNFISVNFWYLDLAFLELLYVSTFCFNIQSIYTQ